MKKLNLILCGILAAGLCLPVSAGIVREGIINSADLPEGTLIYSEDFEAFEETDCDKALEKLGWKKVETLTNFTASYTVENGKLIIMNNFDGAEDSYALMMDNDYLKNVCNADYTYEYEVTYTEAGNTTRFVSLLCNYDGKDNYNTVDMRMRGDGYNQTRRGSEWFHYNNTTCPLRASDTTSVVYQLFGIPYNSKNMFLMGKTVTVRVETSIENGPTVYVNDLMVSDLQANTDKWQTIDAYAMAFKASKLIDAEIDNIRVWTGLSDEPLPLSAEAPETSAPTADAPETSAPVTDEPESSAPTADMTLLFALSAAAAAVVAFAASRKK